MLMKQLPHCVAYFQCESRENNRVLLGKEKEAKMWLTILMWRQWALSVSSDWSVPSAADVGKMRPLHFCIAAHGLISETWNKNIWTSMNNYLMNINEKISIRNTFHYWQYYKICVLKYTYNSVSRKSTSRAVFTSRLPKYLQILTYEYKVVQIWPGLIYM